MSPLLAAFLLLSGFGALHASEALPKDDSVSISCDGTSSSAGFVATADTNVVCRFKNDTISADHLTYNQLTHIIVATGHVKLIDHNNTILAPKIVVPDCTAPSQHFIVTGAHAAPAQ